MVLGGRQPEGGGGGGADSPSRSAFRTDHLMLFFTPSPHLPVSHPGGGSVRATPLLRADADRFVDADGHPPFHGPVDLLRVAQEVP